MSDLSKQQTVSYGPGARLRMVREELKLSIADVAMRLHLKEALIESIESDDYRHAPHAVFLRGYLRSYARLLHLSGDDIIESFNSLHLPEPKSNIPIRQFQNALLIQKERPFRWVIYLIILGMMTLTAIWWHTQRNNPIPRFDRADLIVQPLMQPMQAKIVLPSQKQVEEDHSPVNEMNDEHAIPEHKDLREHDTLHRNQHAPQHGIIP